MSDNIDHRELAARLVNFQNVIDRLVKGAIIARDSGNTNYDFKITELAGHTQELGNSNLQIWEEFVHYLQTANEDTFKDFRSIAVGIGRRLEEHKTQVGAGDTSGEIMSQAKFLEWLRGKMQPLETGIDLEFDFDEFQKECLDPLKKELNLNG